MRIEWYTLRDNGEWVYREVHGPDALCRLDSLDISIALAAVYSGIEVNNHNGLARAFLLPPEQSGNRSVAGPE